MEYAVYFEVFGKKMKTIINASNEEEAKYILMGKIVFHKVVPVNKNDNHFDTLKDVFGFK